LIVIFQASVTRLIPLYAIGVFLSFTLSQTGMARRWWKSGHLKPGEEIKEPGSTIVHDRNWIIKMVINGFGAVLTLVVMMVFAATKFREGAWIIIILTPLLVSGFFTIHHHYKSVAKSLTLAKWSDEAIVPRNRVLLLISGVHQGSLTALRYARRLSDDITAVHISIDPDESRKVRQKWDMYGNECRLVILDSPYRLMIEPLLEYLAYIEEHKRPKEIITIVVPTFIPKEKWSQFLHMRTADTLRNVLRSRADIVIIEVPYQVH
jgi:hypothetical protein